MKNNDYKYLVEDKKTGYRFITTNTEILEDFGDCILRSLGLQGGKLIIKPLDKEIKIIDKFNNEDLKALADLQQHRALVKQYYKENIEPQVMCHTQMNFIEYAQHTVPITNFYVGAYLNNNNSLENFIKDAFYRLKGEIKDQYLVLRKEPKLNWSFNEDNVCTWSLSMRYGLLPSVKIE